MKKIIFILVTLAFISCEKESELPGVIYKKDKLQCSVENWAQGTNEAETLQNMINYLATKGIKAEDPELTKAPADIAFCAACNCPSGRTYIIRVIEGSEKDLNKEGFYK